MYIPNEPLCIIESKWNHGVYDLKYMVSLVDIGKLTPYDFHNITRYSYEGVKASRQKEWETE